MMWYIAVVAILNLAFGYMLARLLGRGRHALALSSGELADASESNEY